MKQELVKNEARTVISAVRERLDFKENVKSLAMLIGFTSAAIAGRVALQHVPSVETITPFAILAGFMLGPVYGTVAGASGFYASNFLVWGGQGPWTVYQMIAAGSAGFIAGVIGLTHRSFVKFFPGSGLWKSSGFKMYMLSVGVGIVSYEFIVNIGGAVTSYGVLSIPMYFVTSAPFSAIHLSSSAAICIMLWSGRTKLPKLGAKIVEKLKIDPSAFAEKEVYRVRGEDEELISRIRVKKSNAPE